MRAIALVDLDDTLFQTLGKCPPDVAVEALAPIGYAADGSPLSYATPRQLSFLAWISESALLVPVTARSRDALERVRISWSSAICAHGGMILDGGGVADQRWRARMAAEAGAHAESLAALSERVAAEAGDAPIRVRVLEEEQVPLYVLAKHGSGDAEALAAVVDRVVPEVPAGWTVHRNGNNAAFLPPFLGKEHAVAWLLPELRRRHPDAPVIGIGDSLTDAPFMRLCDFAMMPTGSQLAAAAFARAA
ncbi:MAG TPA: hypothetical protein VD846_13575 [Allosphingosinicella sp.]|nr:hypothetical protein [Allosphingosinicella sp.]